MLYNIRLSKREISIKTIFFSIFENNYYLIKNENVKVFLLENLDIGANVGKIMP